MKNKKTNFLPVCSLPDDALKLFFRITIWSEANKQVKKNTVKWGKGIKELNELSCKKLSAKEKFLVLKSMERNTLYVPKSYSAKDVIRQLRNAFCHNYISYKDKNYTITPNKLIHIGGSFSLDAIEEFIRVFLNTAQETNIK